MTLRTYADDAREIALLRARAPRTHEAFEVVNEALDRSLPAHSRLALEALALGLVSRCDAGLDISEEDLLDVRQFTLYAQTVAS